MNNTVNDLIAQVTSSERQSESQRNMIMKVEKDIQKTQMDMCSWQEMADKQMALYEKKLEEINSKETNLNFLIQMENILKVMFAEKKDCLQREEKELEELQCKVWYEREKFCEKVHNYTELHGILTYLRNVDGSVETPEDGRIKTLSDETEEQKEISTLEIQVSTLEAQLVAEDKQKKDTMTCHDAAQQNQEQLLEEPVMGSEFMQLQEKLRLSKDVTKNLENKCELMQAEMNRFDFLLQLPAWTLQNPAIAQLKQSVMIYDDLSMDQFQKNTMTLQSLPVNHFNSNAMLYKNLPINQTNSDSLTVQSLPTNETQQSTLVMQNRMMDKLWPQASTHRCQSVQNNSKTHPNTLKVQSEQSDTISRNLSMDCYKQYIPTHQNLITNQFKQSTCQSQHLNQFEERNHGSSSAKYWQSILTEKNLPMDQFTRTTTQKSQPLTDNVLQTRQHNTLDNWIQSGGKTANESNEKLLCSATVTSDNPPFSVHPFVPSGDDKMKYKASKKAFIPRKPSGITLKKQPSTATEELEVHGRKSVNPCKILRKAVQ